MPTYLCHGFRWHRQSVRVFVVVQNLDDASPEWIIPARSASCILESFYNLFDFLPYCSPSGRGFNSSVSSEDGERDGKGRSRSRSQSATAGPNRRSRSQSQSQSQYRSHRSRSRSRQPSQQRRRGTDDGGHGGTGGADFQAQDWSVVKVLEEYDPMNLTEVSRPYAYVADYVVRVDLSVPIAEEIQKYEERIRADRDPPMMGPASDETGKKKSNKRTGWFEKLRDQLQRGEDIRWYVVVNGDEVRDWPDEPEHRPDLTQRPSATREQLQHHAQYAHQQLIFEGKDGARPGRGDTAQLASRTGGDRKPMVPEKDLPAVRRHAPAESQGFRPKTPKGGGLRRIFGRKKSGDVSSP